MNAKLQLASETVERFSEWPAFLRLNFSTTSRGVRLIEKEHRGPLYVQKPFYPEGLNRPHVYLLHPPGGLVSGDHLKIAINAAECANVLVTTPGAGRMYRARPDRLPQQQSIHVSVENNASIEWLPMESILFPDANAIAQTRADLHGNGKIIYWDVLSLGLPANNRTFASGSFNQSLSIYQDTQLQLQERLVLDDRSRSLLSANIGLKDFMVQGFMVAGPFNNENHQLIEQLRLVIESASAFMAVTQIADFIVIRGLDNSSETLRHDFEALWALLRPELLNCPACPPRIWNT